MLSERDTETLLSELCVKLGFCLPPEARHLLATSPPAEVGAFTNAVFKAEGLNPETADRHLYRQVRAMVSRAFERSTRVP